jgi:hypothetical protein
VYIVSDATVNGVRFLLVALSKLVQSKHKN